MTTYIANVTIDQGHRGISNASGQVLEAPTHRMIKPGEEVTGLPEAELQRLLALGAIRDAATTLQPAPPSNPVAEYVTDRFGLRHPTSGVVQLGNPSEAQHVGRAA